ncbi:MAG TPA: MFS transporter [Prolixibacteraceae bacterium]|nr:MFS transporter [Prolixibacteraceae bacterium]
MFKKYITRTVWILSLISLFTDMASEMLYPVMPVFLQSIGFSVLLIGILEGIAEATAGLCKGYFGKLSDNSGKRAPFIQLGYSLSAISKPLMILFVVPVWIFFVRTIDRFGKGLRTGARDAMLSDEATPQTKGKVFGFHRSMDTFGAVLGPLAALIFLYFRPDDYKTLFLIAFLPGIAAVLTTFLLKDKKQDQPIVKVSTPFFSFLKYWKVSPPMYRKVVGGLLVFALFNSSDLLLLLKVKQSGFDDTSMIGLYIFYNLVYALASFPMGIIADKFSLKTVFISGLALFAAVYLGMALAANIYIYLGLFLLYGLYAAATEGIAKAWISNISDPKDTATAIGSFAGFQSIAAMIASSLAGLLWFWFGVETAFIATAVVTVGVIVYFIGFVKLKTVKPINFP